MDAIASPEITPETASDTNEETVRFFIPMEAACLEKAMKGSDDKDPKSWRIGGYASSSDTDLEGESIDPYGIDTSYFLKFGYFNDDHQKGAAHKIGVPTEAFIDSKGLYVRGYLLKDMPAAQGIYRLMQTLGKGDHGRQVGFSVEGKVLEQQGGRILKCWIKDIAITANPVNTKTYAELIKSLKEKYSSVSPEPEMIKSEEVPLSEIKEHTGIDKKQFEKIIGLAEEISKEAKRLISEDAEEFGKALAAGQETGNGGPSGQQTGGDALRVQDLDNKLKVNTNVEDEDQEILKYTMKKSGIEDIESVQKIVEIARLLKSREEVKP